MLDENGLSGKLDILRKWMLALERGEHEMTPRGIRTFRAVLDECHAEALQLETIEAMALSALVAGAREQISLARAVVAEGLVLVDLGAPRQQPAGGAP